MNKLMEYGRKAMFLVRVLSGYEERRIRAYRLQLQQRIEKEAAIEDYLKPIDKNAHMIMNMQLDKEEKQMKEMIKAMQEQALHHKEMAQRQAELASVDPSHQIQTTAELNSVDPSHQIQNMASPPKQEQAN